MATIKIFDIDQLTEDQKQQYGAFKASSVVSDAMGIFNTRVYEPTYNYLRAQNEQLLGDATVDANIVIGTDRPSQISGPGYGAYGAQKANTIDIVVGRMASARSGKGPENGTFINPSFAADAARIYISQMTDIDTNFGIANGRTGNITGRSAIGMKADAVRIVGREGVKIITGASFEFENAGNGNGETNSKGGDLMPAPFIELIAGNVTSENESNNGQKYIQGVGRGENIVDCLEDLTDLMNDFLGAMINFCYLQIVFNTAVQVNVFPFHSFHSATGTTVNQQLLTSVFNALHHIRTQLNSTFPTDYLKVSGNKYIASKTVFAT
jgi:hypothetical protein